MKALVYLQGTEGNELIVAAILIMDVNEADAEEQVLSRSTLLNFVKSLAKLNPVRISKRGVMFTYTPQKMRNYCCCGILK